MKTYFHFAPVFPWPACLKNTRVKVELLMDIVMLLMAEKDTMGGMCHTVRCFAKGNN